jgi:hypothetical protein
MQWIVNFKNAVGRWILNRQIQVASKVKRTYTPLSSAMNIGILYDSTYIDKDAIIHQYVQQLRSEGKKVYMLGFVDMDILPGNKKYTLQSEFCWREKLNFFNLPDKHVFKTFLHTEFDLLINLYETNHLPLLALSAYSHANYRVGPKISGGLNYFDAMIDVGDTPNLNTIIKQMDFYLHAIT